MSPQEMWREFCVQEIPHEVWSYGEAADELAALTLSGRKRSTSSSLPVYEKEGTRVPQAGDYSVITNAASEAVCIVQTTRVDIMPFHAVSAEHAALEGEDDGSLSRWREVHEAFFRAEMAACGLSFCENTPIVCERFRKVWPSEQPRRIEIPVDAVRPLDFKHVSRNTGNTTYEQYFVRDEETGMSVKFIRYPKGGVTPLHDHHCAHGMFVLRGTLVTDRGSFAPGSFVWFPEGDVMTHGASAEEDCDCLFITNKAFDIHYYGLDK